MYVGVQTRIYRLFKPLFYLGQSGCVLKPSNILCFILPVFNNEFFLLPISDIIEQFSMPAIGESSPQIFQIFALATPKSKKS